VIFPDINEPPSFFGFVATAAPHATPDFEEMPKKN
jgi:hypothetical protein